MSIRLTLAFLFSLGIAVPAFAMDEQEEAYNDAARVRSILKTAKKNAPDTPQRRHQKKIAAAYAAAQKVRKEIPFQSPPRKPRDPYQANWTRETDPNARAFPTVSLISQKDSIAANPYISDESKARLEKATADLRKFYSQHSHRDALRRESLGSDDDGN